LALLGGCAGEHPVTPFAAAQRYVAAGQETEARRALAHELLLRPDNLSARYNLAVLLTRIGHTDEARVLYEENMRRGWHLPTVVNLSALEMARGQDERARQLLEAATRHFPHEAVPWYLLAAQAVRRGQPEMARRDYDQAIRADAKNGYAQIRYARFLAGHGNLPAALAHSRRAVALLPDVGPCWRIRGEILSQAGRYGEALAAYQHSAALDPDPAIRQDIIATLRKLGKNARAARMQQALKQEAAMPQGGK
jgi:tetratricopeptide (TPR) repeat protein